MEKKKKAESVMWRCSDAGEWRKFWSQSMGYYLEVKKDKKKKSSRKTKAADTQPRSLVWEPIQTSDVQYYLIMNLYFKSLNFCNLSEQQLRK